jgi:hypothetical protein
MMKAGGKYFAVSCVRMLCPGYQMALTFDSESAAAEAWNRRPTPDACGFDITRGERMYIDSSMQYRNGTVTLTIKRKPGDAAPTTGEKT